MKEDRAASQIERVRLTRSAGRHASLKEALTGLMDLAPRRVVLGVDADALDMKTRIEMAEDAHAGLNAAMIAAAAGCLFVVEHATLADNLSQILDDTNGGAVPPPFDVTPIFMPEFEGRSCPLFTSSSAKPKTG